MVEKKGINKVLVCELGCSDVKYMELDPETAQDQQISVNLFSRSNFNLQFFIYKPNILYFEYKGA